MRKIVRSRKAEFSVLLAIIGVVIVAIPLIAVMYKVVVSSDKLNQVEKCKLSIFAAHQAANLKLKTATIVDIIPNLQCVPQEIIIKPGDIKRTKNGKMDTDMLKAKLAGLVYDCYDMVGKLQMDPYASSIPGKDKTFCMTCYNIRFSKEFVEEAKNDFVFDGYEYYTATRVLPGKDKTLYEMIQKSTPTIEELAELKNNKESWYFSETNPYVVFWQFARWDNADAIIFAPALIKKVAQGRISKPSEIFGKFYYQSILLEPESMLSAELDMGSYKQPICTILVN